MKFIVVSILLLICSLSVSQAQDKVIFTQTEGENQKPSFRIGFSAGPGYLAGSTHEAENTLLSRGLSKEDVDDFFGQFRYGWSANGDFHYLISRNFSAGINALWLTSGAERWIAWDPAGTGKPVDQLMKKNTGIFYWGPGFIVSKHFGKAYRWQANLLASAGMAMCSDENSFLGSHVDLTGKTYGGLAGGGIFFFLTKKISLGMNGDVFAARLGKVRVKYDSYTTTVDLRKEKIGGVSINKITMIKLAAGINIYL